MSLDHLDLRELFQLYVDGDLSTPERLLIEEHVAICTVCRPELEALQQIVARLEAMPLVEPRPGFGDRAMAALARQHHKIAPSLVERVGVPAFSGALALLGLGVLGASLGEYLFNLFQDIALAAETDVVELPEVLAEEVQSPSGLVSVWDAVWNSVMSGSNTAEVGVIFGACLFFVALGGFLMMSLQQWPARISGNGTLRHSG